MFSMDNLLHYVVIATMGGLAAFLAHRGIAVFNDALRPIIPEYLEGRMSKASLFATSFALSFGLVIGFGIPFSIGSSILLVHSILLGTDVIGTWSPSGKLGGVIAIIGGAAYGFLLLIGLAWIVEVFALLPVNFLAELGSVGKPVITAYAAFPALVVAMRYGYRKGLFTLILTFVARQVLSATTLGEFSLGGNAVVLNPNGFALFFAIAIMLYFAISEKKAEGSVDSNTQLVGLFSERIARVRKHILILAVMGGVVTVAISMGFLAGDPISLNLLKEGKDHEAAIAALARTIGFIPLIATTSIATGVYGPMGMTFVSPIGILSPSPILAFAFGFATIVLEVLLLSRVAILLDRFPGVRACADNIRTAMVRVLEVALLVGSMIAAENMISAYPGMGGVGFLFITGIYILNQTSKKPLVNMAVGPVSAIAFGIILNILFLLGLLG